MVCKDLTDYAESILTGGRPSGKWVYAAARRFMRDLERKDLTLDAAAVDHALEFFTRLPLVGEDTGKPFDLHPWQRFVIGNLVGWRNADGRRRFKLAMLQVARGNGKTTLMAGLALWDLLGGEGRRVHVIANNEDQAGICLDTARTMAAIAEQSHDERGLIWPPAVAPYDVWITPIGEAALVAADELAATLTAEGLAVVVDDRDSSPGVRFADADLIGVPHRVTIGKRLEKDGNGSCRSFADK
jgi:hypothetical protein